MRSLYYSLPLNFCWADRDASGLRELRISSDGSQRQAAVD